MNQKGFTLIELLTVVAILSVLSYLGVASLQIYQANAAYSIVGDTLRKYQIAFEAGITADEPPVAVPLYRQAARGPITDAAAHDLLPGVPVPANVTIRVQYDASCTSPACQSAMIQINHCKGEEYMQWIRFGDGFGLKLENIAGEGCA